MLTKIQLHQILEALVATGADFGEIFLESTSNNSARTIGEKIENANSGQVYGVGLRLIKNDLVTYGSLNSHDFDQILELAHHLASSYTEEAKTPVKPLKEVKYDDILKVVKAPETVTNSEKRAILMTAYETAKQYDERISQVIVNLSDTSQEIVVANTNGVLAHDVRTNLRLYVSAVAREGERSETGSDNVGAISGYELLSDLDQVKLVARNAAQSAITMLDAIQIAGGPMTVVVHNAFGGVLLHEACVHSLEATSVARGASVFCNKLGEKIASDVVTAIDDGTLANEWGSINVDDEGNLPQRNVLIENGILKSYLVDYRNSLTMNHPITGSGRRQSYRYAPTSRMTNTFFAPGPHSFEDIIANTEYGLFAKSMGGGSVNPATGEFNFAVAEGYLIENGKITKPVKGAALIGSGSQILMNIDMIGNNLALGCGMCGSESGAIPVTVGQPTIRVQNLVVGGRGQ